MVIGQLDVEIPKKYYVLVNSNPEMKLAKYVYDINTRDGTFEWCTWVDDALKFPNTGLLVAALRKAKPPIANGSLNRGVMIAEVTIEHKVKIL